MKSGSTSCGPPGSQEDPLDESHHEVETDPDPRDGDERCEQQRGVEQASPGKVDEDAQPAVGACPFGDDGANDGEGPADAEPAEDLRQRAGDLERPEDLPP